jgi:hypothetical protein
MLSYGIKCYHLGCNIIIWDNMYAIKANVIMLKSGANVIIWCYHVMLSSGMITPPFFIFPGNFTHSWQNRFLPVTERIPVVFMCKKDPVYCIAIPKWSLPLSSCINARVGPANFFKSLPIGKFLRLLGYSVITNPKFLGVPVCKLHIRKFFMITP